MIVPEIEEFSLPPKFTSWRRGQPEMIERVVASDRRFTAVCASTGAGKSILYMALSSCFGRTCVLTSTKALQDQLRADFGSMGLVDMAGMNNYPCHKATQQDPALPFFHGSEPVACDEGPCHAGFKCDLYEAGCEYFDRKRLAKGSQLVVTNYAYWLRVQNQGDTERGGIGDFDLLVCDEAHNAPETLAEYLTVEIGAAELAELVDMDLPGENGDEFEYWRKWAESVVRKSSEAIENTDSMELSRAKARHLKALKGLRDRAMAIFRAADLWVAEEYRDRRGSRKLRFAPVDVRSYARMLFLNSPKVLLVSATVRPKTLDLLGIPSGESDFLESSYSFDPARRPVIHIPTLRMNHGVTLDEMKWWVNRIDQIVDRRLDRKGILHTVSYKRAKFFMDHTRHRAIAWMPESHQLRKAVADFKSERNDWKKLLVSPALTTGFDFPMESCRFQIIGKIPFPDTRSKLLQAREEIDKDYGAYVAAQTLVQMCGRGVRSEDDFCENFIIDDNWFWFWKRYRHFAPAWFGKAVKTSQTVPAAMDLDAETR